MLQELLAKEKAQASQGNNEEVDLDELLDVSLTLSNLYIFMRT